MKRLLAVLAGVMFASASYAADLPVKAPVQMGYPVGAGFYYGLAAIGDATTIPGGPSGAAQLQAGGGLVVGYTFPISGSFAFIEGSAYIENVNGAGNGFSLSGPVKFQQTVGFGVDGILQTIAGMAPFNSATPSLPSLPLLPAGVTTVGQHMYVHATIEEADVTARFVTPTVGSFSNREWTIRAGGGIGLLNRLSNNTVIDLRTTAFADSTELCVGPFGCPHTGFGVQQAIMVKW
jgi:hypothetical protein